MEFAPPIFTSSFPILTVHSLTLTRVAANEEPLSCSASVIVVSDSEALALPSSCVMNVCVVSQSQSKIARRNEMICKAQTFNFGKVSFL